MQSIQDLIQQEPDYLKNIPVEMEGSSQIDSETFHKILDGFTPVDEDEYVESLDASNSFDEPEIQEYTKSVEIVAKNHNVSIKTTDPITLWETIGLLETALTLLKAQYNSSKMIT